MSMQLREALRVPGPDLAPAPERAAWPGMSRGKLAVVLLRTVIFALLLVLASLRPLAELYAIAAIHGISNLVYPLYPSRAGVEERVRLLFVFDTAVICSFIYYSSPTGSPSGSQSFLVVYFLMVLFAALAPSLAASLLGAFAAVAVYGVLSLGGEPITWQLLGPFLLEAAFLVATAIFVGYLARNSEREREAHRIATDAVRARERLSLLFDLARKLSSTHDVDQLQRELLDVTLSALEAQSGSLMLYDPRRGDMAVVVGRGLQPETLGRRVALGEGIAGRAACQEKAIMLAEDSIDSAGFRDLMHRDDIRSAICAPLRVGDRLVGVLNVNRTAGAFTDDDAEMLGAFGNQAAVAIDNAMLYRRLITANRELSATNLRLQETLQDLQQAQHVLIQHEKMATVGLLAAGVAHEFNNLIGGMYSLADFARSNREDPEVVDRALEVVIQNSRRAREVTEGLLSFSRQREDVREEAFLAELVENVLELTSKEIEKNSVQVVREHEHSVPPVQVTVGQIQQVILNLVINALHAVGRQGILTVRTRAVGEEGWIEVEDNGEGIDPAVLPRIFEPFFTTKGALGGSRTPGTGLGLSVSYNLVQAHDGELEVESRPGEGTTVRVRLPLLRAGVRAPAVIRESAQVERPAALPTEQLRILVVEDDPALLTLLQEVLEPHRLLVALDADEAMEIVGREGLELDYVILDLVLPGSTDGFGILRALQELPSPPRVVITTGRMEDEAQREARSRVHAFLAKPYEIARVLAALEPGRASEAPTPGQVTGHER